MTLLLCCADELFFPTLYRCDELFFAHGLYVCMASDSPSWGNLWIFDIFLVAVAHWLLKTETLAALRLEMLCVQLTLFIRFDAVCRDRLLRAPLSYKRGVFRSNIRNAKPRIRLTRGLPVPRVISRLPRRSRRTAVRSCSHTVPNSTASYHRCKTAGGTD